MRKQELIHMHALFVEIADTLPFDGSAADVSDYRSLSVRPSSLHRPKDDHRRAVMALARGVSAELEDERRKPPVRH